MILAFLCIPAGIVSDIGLYRRLSLRYPLTLIFSLIAHLALLYEFPYSPVRIGKGLILAQLLFLAAFNDARTHEIPDWIHILLLLTGFLQLVPQDAVAGFFIVSVPFLIVALLTHGGIGAGDIKFMAAYGFVLGAFGSLLALAIGSLLLTAVYLIYFRSRNNRYTLYAMAPYLSIGCFFAYLLTS